jgi:hypothetical protein
MMLHPVQDHNAEETTIGLLFNFRDADQLISAMTYALGIIAKYRGDYGADEASTKAQGTIRELSSALHCAKKIWGFDLFQSPQRQEADVLKTNRRQDIVIQCDHCEKHVDFGIFATVQHILNQMRGSHGFQIAEIDGPAICPDCQGAMTHTGAKDWRLSRGPERWLGLGRPLGKAALGNYAKSCMAARKRKRCMYTTTMIINERPLKPGAQSDENPPVPTPHHMNHPSMAALKDWASFHHLCIGTPHAGSAYFSVEHRDGSPLTPEEMERLNEVASPAAFKEKELELIQANPMMSSYARPWRGWKEGAEAWAPAPVKPASPGAVVLVGRQRRGRLT